MSSELHVPGEGAPPSAEGPPDLSQAALEAKHLAAMRAGLFCAACGQAIDEPGWEYFSVKTELRNGNSVVVSKVAYICRRDCCEEARETLNKSAAGRREWRAWEIFYVESPDAPPEDLGTEGAEERG